MSFEGHNFKPDTSLESEDARIEAMMALEKKFASRLKEFEDNQPDKDFIYGPGGNETDRAKAQKAFDIYEEIILEAELSGDSLTAELARKVQELERNRIIICDGRAVLFRNMSES